jgi:hypothetical protein
MEVAPSIESTAVILRDSIQAELEYDTPFGGWLAAEGERVRDNANILVEAAHAKKLYDLLGAISVHDYLGESWLGVHSKSWEIADMLQALVELSRTPRRIE